MISANEIRIGNLVTVDNEEYHPTIKGQPLVVEEIWLIGNSLLPKSNYGFTLTNGTDNYSQAEEFIQPIEITEEWLIKFGFECKNKCEFKDLSLSVGGILFYSDSQDNYSEICVFTGYDFEISLFHMKYVHQLQNLYFAITGKELTLNK